jgi:hypothetical protein
MDLLVVQEPIMLNMLPKYLQIVHLGSVQLVSPVLIIWLLLVVEVEVQHRVVVVALADLEQVLDYL